MEILLLIAMGVAIYQLWRRVDALELRIGEIGHAPRWAAPEIPARPAAEPTAPDLEEPAAPSLAKEFRPPQVAREPEPAPPAETLQAEPLPETEPEFEPTRESRLPKFDFEDLFGRLLPIWAGGITLAVAGFFIVRYSIEAGLLTPSVRVVLGFLFGLGLLGGAEAAFRLEQRIANPRVRQALAGAGLATLYASFYLAGSHYGLIGPVGAFIGLAAVTAAAIALAGRFGLPCAVLGLIGGFAAPLLVGGDESNLPLLAAYLGLVTAGLMVMSRQRRWAWLGLSALGGGLAWGLALLAAFDGTVIETLALGGFLIALGVVLPTLAMPEFGASGRRLAESLAASVAALQMAALVGAADYSMLSWGLFALLAGGLAVLGWSQPAVRRASAFAALIVPLLLSQWSAASGVQFAIVAGGLTLILAGVPALLVRLGRFGRTDVLQIAVASLGLFWACWYRFGDFTDRTDWLLGLTGLGLAILPLVAAQALVSKPGGRVDWPVPLLLSSGFVLLLFAGLLATPAWSAPLVAAALGGVLLALAQGRDDPSLTGLVWAAGIAGVFLLLSVDRIGGEFERMVGLGDTGAALLSALRWSMPMVLFAGLARFDHRRPGQALAGCLAAAFGYAALAQLLPADTLAWASAALALAALAALRERTSVQLTFAAIAAAWAVVPLGHWMFVGTAALAGEPLLVTRLPALPDVALHLMPAVAIVLAAWAASRHRLTHYAPQLAALGALTGLVPLHIGYKQVFAIAGSEDFARLGLSERTVWQALLLGLAYGLSRLEARVAGARVAALVLGGAALLHWTWFSLIVHNPLYAMQAVGPVPLFNLLLASYGLAVAALVTMRGRLRDEAGNLRVLADGLIMALIGLFAISALRQGFAGTYLVGPPVSAAEDLLRSLTGIVLAIGYLAWGARRNLRSWRIGSLVLMVLAVLKVFLVDAAGLEDLARIASFVALGFSLIGIGWFYARQLRRDAGEA